MQKVTLASGREIHVAENEHGETWIHLRTCKGMPEEMGVDAEHKESVMRRINELPALPPSVLEEVQRARAVNRLAELLSGEEALFCARLRWALWKTPGNLDQATEASVIAVRELVEKLVGITGPNRRNHDEN